MTLDGLVQRHLEASERSQIMKVDKLPYGRAPSRLAIAHDQSKRGIAFVALVLACLKESTDSARFQEMLLREPVNVSGSFRKGKTRCGSGLGSLRTLPQSRECRALRVSCSRSRDATHNANMFGLITSFWPK